LGKIATLYLSTQEEKALAEITKEFNCSEYSVLKLGLHCLVDQLKVRKGAETKTDEGQPMPTGSSDSLSIYRKDEERKQSKQFALQEETRLEEKPNPTGQLTELPESKPQKRSAKATLLKLLEEELRQSEAKTA
jgi:hypothetical protein